MDKRLIKDIVPPFIIKKLTGLFYGWSGNYRSWKEAEAQSTGYDAPAILETVKEAVLKVKKGEAVAERDSVIFDTPQISFPLLSSLLYIAQCNNGKLNLVDFGGSLGSSYFQCRQYFDHLDSLSWNIVEQSNFVKIGKELITDSHLKFYETVDQVFAESKPDTLILSSVIQYIQDFDSLINYFISKGFTYIIIDRTPFINAESHRITIQKVHPSIYKASYPCWFFNEEKFLRLFEDKFKILYDFEAMDKANINGYFKGFFLVKK